MEVSNLFVCVMGMAVTFIGLTCLIFLTIVMGKIVRSIGGAETPVKEPASPVPSAPPEAIPNRQELIAAISAVLAEEMGTDVTGIRILSMKKIS